MNLAHFRFDNHNYTEGPAFVIQYDDYYFGIAKVAGNELVCIAEYWNEEMNCYDEVWFTYPDHLDNYGSTLELLKILGLADVYLSRSIEDKEVKHFFHLGKIRADDIVAAMDYAFLFECDRLGEDT
jgi:hypothetical protein